MKLCVFDRSRGQEEGEEAEKILFFFPTATPLQEQVTLVGLWEGLLAFSRWAKLPVDPVSSLPQCRHTDFFDETDGAVSASELHALEELHEFEWIFSDPTSTSRLVGRCPLLAGQECLPCFLLSVQLSPGAAACLLGPHGPASLSRASGISMSSTSARGHPFSWSL